VVHENEISPWYERESMKSSGRASEGRKTGANGEGRRVMSLLLGVAANTLGEE